MLFAGCGLGFAQKPQFDCSITALNLDSANIETIDQKPIIEIGRFEIYQTMEEERIIKFFKLPKTSWFVIASIYTTDESMASKSGRDSINLELSFARKRRRNVLMSPAVAISETPLNTFDIARVTTIVRLGNNRRVINLECKTPVSQSVL
jgi:hypothetical protein